jgi:hypothetical protein
MLCYTYTYHTNFCYVVHMTVEQLHLLRLENSYLRQTMLAAGVSDDAAHASTALTTSTTANNTNHGTNTSTVVSNANALRGTLSPVKNARSDAPGGPLPPQNKHPPSHTSPKVWLVYVLLVHSACTVFVCKMCERCCTIN